MYVSKPKRPTVIFFFNNVWHGTGPFQRAIRINPDKFEVILVSFLDDQKKFLDFAQKHYPIVKSHTIIGLNGNSKPTAALFEMLNILRKHSDSLVYTCHTKTSFIVAIFRLFRKKKCAQIWFMGTELTRYKVFRRLITEFFASQATRVFCVSNSLLESNFKFSWLWKNKADRIKVIYNGVDLKSIKPRNNNIFSRPIRLCFTGDLKPIKNIDDIVTAHSVINNTTPHIKIETYLVGDFVEGEERYKQKIKQLIAEFELGNQIVITGMLHRSKVFELLRESDIFVLPSSVEGLSESLGQAMAAALPVVVSNIRPNMELVTDDFNGFVSELNSPKSLAACITNFLENQDLIEVMGQRNLTLAREHLDIDKIVKEYEKEFISITNKMINSAI